MHPDELYFIILLCLMPDDFASQGESIVWIVPLNISGINWVNN